MIALDVSLRFLTSMLENPAPETHVKLHHERLSLDDDNAAALEKRKNEPGNNPNIIPGRPDGGSSRQGKPTCPKHGCAICKHQPMQSKPFPPHLGDILNEQSTSSSAGRPEKSLRRAELGKRSVQASCRIEYRLKAVPLVGAAPFIPGISKWWRTSVHSVPRGSDDICVLELGKYERNLGYSYEGQSVPEPLLAITYSNATYTNPRVKQ